MKTKLVIFFLTITHFFTYAQTGTFGNMTFEMPSSWERTDLNANSIMLNTKGGSSDDYCVVMLKKSEIPYATIVEFFDAEWKKTNSTLAGIQDLKEDQIKKIDGWFVKNGGAIFKTEHETGVYMLFCCKKNNYGYQISFTGKSGNAIEQFDDFCQSIHFK